METGADAAAGSDAALRAQQQQQQQQQQQKGPSGKKGAAASSGSPTKGDTIHTLCTSNGSPYLNFQNRIMCEPHAKPNVMPLMLVLLPSNSQSQFIYGHDD